jgi:hypothetical protein
MRIYINLFFGVLPFFHTYGKYYLMFTKLSQLSKLNIKSRPYFTKKETEACKGLF